MSPSLLDVGKHQPVLESFDNEQNPQLSDVTQKSQLLHDNRITWLRLTTKGEPHRAAFLRGAVVAQRRVGGGLGRILVDHEKPGAKQQQGDDDTDDADHQQDTATDTFDEVPRNDCAHEEDC